MTTAAIMYYIFLGSLLILGNLSFITFLIILYFFITEKYKELKDYLIYSGGLLGFLSLTYICLYVFYGLIK